MEVAFKILFALAILIFCVTTVGIFLIIVKIVLMFQPQVNLMGLVISWGSIQ